MGLKLKRCPEGGYDLQVCAIQGCSTISSIIDSTQKLATIADIPLCEKHNLARLIQLYGSAE